MIPANSFQADCLRTWRVELSLPDQMANAALGLGGECGELLRSLVPVLRLISSAGLVTDQTKKHLFQGHELDPSAVVDELGDVFYYAAVFAYLLGVSLDDVLLQNVQKREKRYPRGFSVAASVDRAEAGADAGTDD